MSNDKDERLPRREFIKRSAAATAGAVLAGILGQGDKETRGFAPSVLAQVKAGAKGSLVVVVTSDASIQEDSPDRANAAVVEKMLEKGITALAGKSGVKEAWRTFFKPSDSVATCDAGFHLQNVPEVTIATLKGLAFAGVADMKLGSHYVTLSQQRPSLAAKAAPWISAVKEGLKAADISEDVIDPALYNIPARYAVDPFDALLVVATLKPHYISGVSGVVKHFATLSKRGPKEYHPDAMATAGSVLQTDFSNHGKLVVVDALRFAKRFAPSRLRTEDLYYAKALILSTDPVAADTVALDLFLKAGCKPSGGIPPRIHIEAADKEYHAGVSDLAKIDVIEVRV